uniref:Uncharacterized protein n=1 Tax=Arundo donax TaxID=35708 RepID=A0A0A9EJI5_ARUDO
MMNVHIQCKIIYMLMNSYA